MKHFEELYDIMVDGAPVFIPESVRPHVRKLVSIYATAVAQDALNRAAEGALTTLVFPVGTDVEKLCAEGLNITFAEIENYKVRVCKDSILNTPINLL